jgi:phosphonoacetaldehyde hydrolase
MSGFAWTRTYRGPLRAALLDWAGTTLDYGCFAPAVVFVEVFRKAGVPITMEEARAPMGAHKRVHIRRITEQPAVRRRWKEAHGRTPTEDDVERMFADFVPLQLACLGQYARLIPGTLDAVRALRAMGLKIGSTTGYTREMMEVLLLEGRRQGYEPDTSVCATDVPAGRPEPWMCLQNAMQLGVFPMEAIVKVGDTLPDIEEGLNAGMWTVGVAMTGNEVGLTEADLGRLPAPERRALRERAYDRMSRTGAHEIVDTIAEAPAAVERIAARLAAGARP